MSKAIEDIAAERASQIEKGWTPEHDAEHGIGHLVNRAMVYAASGRYAEHLQTDLLRDQLVKGAAMLAAAIEVLDGTDRTIGTEEER